MKTVNESQKLMDDISSWSDSQFGKDGRDSAILHHLKEEIEELMSAHEEYFMNYMDQNTTMQNLEILFRRVMNEYADCFMLLLDSAAHFGINSVDLIDIAKAKLDINKERKWGKPDENGVVKHIS